jgi:hypothetical protein
VHLETKVHVAFMELLRERDDLQKVVSYSLLPLRQTGLMIALESLIQVSVKAKVRTV